MKFARIGADEGARLIATDDRLGGLTVADVLGGHRDPDVVRLLMDPGVLATLRDALDTHADPGIHAPEDRRTRTPLRTVRRVLCIGLNYRDHANELGAQIPRSPLLFGRWAESLTGPYDDIVVPPAVEQLDYEAELAVVIGRAGRDLTRGAAREVIAGYLVANDLSARDLQFDDGQWTRGKNLDGSCPIGPVVVPAADLDVRDLGIRCQVGDEVRQDSRTDQLIFGVEQILAHLSRTLRLLPGDLVLTGTPPGVAMGAADPQWLAHGDLVRCDIDGIGRLSNRIVSRTA